jgi:hypothetical protein
LEATMKKLVLVSLLTAAAFTLPVSAYAQDGDAAAGAATGAAVGAGVGFAVGGPVGAAVGAGVGGTVGAGAAEERRREEWREERPMVRERECIRDSYGNQTCTEVRR